jgi:hypothetical protein
MQMHELWGRNGDVVAWTTHDGPGRPPQGPSPRWAPGLAGAWAGYTVLAVIGCAVMHQGGTSHVAMPLWQNLLAAGVLLGIPLTIYLLARGSEAGAWVSVAVAAACTAVAASQVAIVPWYTVLEASGFAALGGVGLVLGLRLRRSASWQPPATAPMVVEPVAPAAGHQAAATPERVPATR